MVSRIWKGDSAQEVRGRTVVPRGHVAPRAPKIGGGGGSMRLAIAFLIALAGIFRLKSTGRTSGPADWRGRHGLAAEKLCGSMRTRRVLNLVAAVLLAMAGLGYGLHVADADDAGRAIPTIGVTSPSPGTIQVVWGAPGDTDTLNSYRVMWALEGQSHSYSEANTDTGGNAYPLADATSYTITGLAAGDYHVKVRARYDDGSGPFKGSAVVRVAAAAEREAEDPDRSIPAIGVASPAAGTIEVIWGAPGDTDTLNSYRVMWALEGQSHSYSEANTDTGGNAYPPADATSYTITGLAAGDFHVKVRARYDDNGSGPFKGSAVVRVEGTPEPAGEPEIAEQQAAEPCADPRIESVGGSATNTLGMAQRGARPRRGPPGLLVRLPAVLQRRLRGDVHRGGGGSRCCGHHG